MINITPVDKQCNLFLVESVYSEDLVAEIQTLDLMSYPYEKVLLQEHIPRRNLQFIEGDVLSRLNQETEDNLLRISQSIGLSLGNSLTHVWLDHDQFSMVIHEDNSALDIAMQVYLLPNDVGLGTKFYHGMIDNRGNGYAGNLRYDFPYVVNTGYIMINASGQFHGIPRTLPKGTLRCSSYTYLKRN